MNVVQMLFKVVTHFVDVEQASIDRLRSEATADLDSWKLKEGPLGTFAKLQDKWYVQLFNLFFSLVLFRWLTAWLNSPVSSNSDSDSDSDDDDDDDDAQARDKAILKLINKLDRKGEKKGGFFEKL